MEAAARFQRMFCDVFGAYIIGGAVGLTLVFHPDAGLALVCLGLAARWPGIFVRAVLTPRLVVVVSLATASLLVAGLHQQALLDFTQFVGGMIGGIVLHHYYRCRDTREHPALAAILAALVGVLTIVSGIAEFPLPTDALRLLFVVLVNYSLLTAGNRLALGMFVLGVTASLLVDSKTMLAAVLCGAAVAMALRPRRTVPLFRVVLAGGFMVVIGFGLLSMFAPARLHDLTAPSTSISTISRLELLRAAALATAENPLTGVGPSGLHVPDTFERYYWEYDLERLIASGLTRSFISLSDAGFTSGPHNLWADITSSYGLPMLVVLVVGIVLGWRQAVTHWLPLKLAVLLSIGVMGMGWHYSVYAYGVAALGFSLGPLLIMRKRYRYQLAPCLAIKNA